MDFIFLQKIQPRFSTRSLITHDGYRLAVIRITIMVKVDDFTAYIITQFICRIDFGSQKPLGKKPIRLLSKTNNWLFHPVRHCRRLGIHIVVRLYT